MGFFTELFARPRPAEHQRYRAAMAVLEARSNREARARPAHHEVRLAREMANR